MTSPFFKDPNLFPDRLQRVLLQESPEITENTSLNPAAVLLPFVYDDRCWKLLFTRRTEKLANHSGQVSFPGGSIDEGETARDAALRETIEEIGVRPTDLIMLGHLPVVQTRTRFFITSYVGILAWPITLYLNPEEVARTFLVPLSWLSDPSNHHMAPYQHAPDQPTHWLPFFNSFDNEIIWGVTGMIIKLLLERLAV